MSFVSWLRFNLHPYLNPLLSRESRQNNTATSASLSVATSRSTEIYEHRHIGRKLLAQTIVSTGLRLVFAYIRLPVSLQRFAPELIEKLDHPLIAHELRLLIAIVVHDLIERASHAFRRLHRGIADGDDEIQHHEIRHAQNFFERFLDMNADPLCSEPERSRRQMHQGAGIGQAIGEMRLIPAKGMRALYRAPLAPAVADDNDKRRRFGPAGTAPLLLHRFVRRHLIGGVPELKDTLLLHPVDKIGIDLGIAAKEIFLYLGIFDHDVFPGL